MDRSLYELIWIEFYERQPQALLDAVREAEAAGRPIVDKLVVMNHPRDVIFHKHRMYNLGIVLSEGEICVICDSDAMFTPTFIEKIIAAFEEHPQSVVHLDEVRSVDRQFYPFNFPTFAEFLASPCPNWTGRTTRGLDNSPDMLHEANYGACLAAKRSDILRVGGADEHLDYLGYICGPYDLTFRLVNAGCQERWLTDEFLYHTWHPGESGINIDYHGPSDGRGMSLRSLETRRTGAIQPGLENGAIRALRNDPALDRQSALAQLTSRDDQEWRDVVRLAGDDTSPRLVQKAYRKSFDIYLAGGCWFGVPTTSEPLDLDKFKSGLCPGCVRASARNELQRAIDANLRHAPFHGLVKGGFGTVRSASDSISNLMFACWHAAKHLANEWLGQLGFEFNRPYNPHEPFPQLVRQRFFQHNIVFYQGGFYGVHLSCRSFEPSRIVEDDENPYICGSSIADVKVQIRQWKKTAPRQPWTLHNVVLLRPAVRLVRPLVPDALVSVLRARARARAPVGIGNPAIETLPGDPTHDLRQVAS
ncbi:MAG: glycosyltransferase [Planctomycetia bacterium]|nr:glycosyltransferase [Planctomycetia bacterium]